MRNLGRFLRRIGAALAIASVLTGGAASASERYYAIIFAAQSEPRRAKLSHTFMALVKVESIAEDRSSMCVDTISWIPPSGSFRVWDLCSEPGVNFDLSASIQLVRSKGECVYAWGPFELTCDAYTRFIEQKKRLDLGARKYKAIDVPLPWIRADNCWHAITAAIPGDTKCHSPWWDFGEPSGRHIAGALRKRGMIVSEGHDWLFSSLDLEVSSRDALGRVQVQDISSLEVPGSVLIQDSPAD